MSHHIEPLGPEQKGSKPDDLTTKEYKPNPGSAEPIRMANALGQELALDPQRSSRALLFSRVRLLCVMGIGGWSGVIIVLFAGVDPVLRVGAVVPPVCAAVLVMTTVAPLIFAVLLFVQPGLSVGWLRAIEVQLVCLCAATLVCLRYSTLDYALVTSHTATLYANSINNLLLLCVVIAFGVVIPNSWIRTLLVVSGLSLISLSAEAVCRLRHFPAGGQYLLSSVIMTALTLFIGACVTVFVAYMTERLRRQVGEARRLLREYGQYRLTERVGGGGMGEVYLAEHVLLRMPCAVKVIRPERAGDPNYLRRFEHEVHATATLTHPNTIQIYDYGKAEDGTFYYVMEYLPGQTLGELVRGEGPLPPERTVHFLRQICGALREAHGHGLIHRDIKPGNVMVCERGGIHDVAKLLDFGLVLPPVDDGDGERLTQVGAIPGTAAYMSPEQADGQKNLDGRSDIYSVGALAYFLLTGQPPFADRSWAKTLAAHLYEEPEPLSARRPDVPRDLDAIVLQCLAKKPEDRFPNAESLDRALAGYA